MATYDFNVREFSIVEIRSANSDTLEASTAIRVTNPGGGLHRDWAPNFVALGDRHKGDTVALNVGLDGVDVPDPTDATPDGGAIYWSFVLINKGSPDATLEPALNAVASGIVGDETPTGDVMSEIANLGVPGASGLIDLFSGCDGIVAAQAWSYTAAQLAGFTNNSSKSFTNIDQYPGLDSPAGCGANSFYDVTYDVYIPGEPAGGGGGGTSVKVPYLAGKSPEEAMQVLSEVGLYGQIRRVLKSNFEDPTVGAQQPLAGTSVPKGTTVYFDVFVWHGGPKN